jgi:hypothetical protein
MGNERVVLCDLRVLERAESECASKINEIFDKNTMPSKIGDLRKLLAMAWMAGYRSGAKACAEKVESWKVTAEPPQAEEPPNGCMC